MGLSPPITPASLPLRRLLLLTLKRCLYVYSTCHVVTTHLGEIVYCSGPSMHPTVQDGDLVLSERLSVTLGHLRRGDIVTCLMAGASTASPLLCKRLALKEGDRIGNDAPFAEWIPLRRVPKGHVFLLGDNSTASSDSRQFGPVPEGLVFSRLVFRIWPFNRAGWLSTHWFYED